MVGHTETYHATLGDGGRIVLPAPLRKRLGVKKGESVVFEVKKNHVEMKSFDQRIDEIQTFFAKYKKPGESVVDELIRDRREEAKRENRT